MRLTTLALTLLFASGAQAQGVLEERLATWRAAGASDFSAERGATLWQRERIDSSGRARSCATCHSSDLRQGGRHINTGKAIEPMAPSVNPKRLTSVAEVEKWLKRNCNWTFDRECSPQEKGDLLSFIAKQ